VKYDEKTNLRDAVVVRREEWFDLIPWPGGKMRELEMVLLKKLPAHLTSLSRTLDAVGVSSKHPAGPLPPGAKLQHI